MIGRRAPRARFARSINVERDRDSTALDSYLPVARATDAVHRLALALGDDALECAISVTGPYGSGKSSLAILVDSLLGPARDRARCVADELLAAAAPETMELLAAVRRRLHADETGFVRCLVTAQREPVAHTVVRALLAGAERFTPRPGHTAKRKRVLARLTKMQRAMTGPDRERPDTRSVREALFELAELAPVLLLIDEFGKNLEAFADSRADADVFLLQELAEWTRRVDGSRVAVVTMQHMAFDEHVSGASSSQRREWAKIQGRFEDVPFVDSAIQTRALIAATFEPADRTLAPAVRSWAEDMAGELMALGFSELADPELLARCWPLHPLALAVLPDLCERYGQHERTLFSFLAGRAPSSVGAFLADNTWRRGDRLPAVRLDQLYDYFVSAAAALAGVSAAASRFVEIDTRIRDAPSLSQAQRRVVKSVGLLNLVSTGGSLRASHRVVSWVASDGDVGTEDSDAILARLVELERAGLVTFRDFADEYRVWQGSDFDIRTAVDLARRRMRDEKPAAVLESVRPLAPLVAGRHSHESGTLRAFARRFVDPTTPTITPPSAEDRSDGLVLYALDDAPLERVERVHGAKPVVVVTSANTDGLIDAAIEVAAAQSVLDNGEGVREDWVARRELTERVAEARVVLDAAFEAAFGTGAEGTSWWLLNGPRQLRIPARGGSPALSWVADRSYAKAPVVRNDMVNRHELTSQGAKARRELMGAMLSRAGEERLGIEGFGPERAMYEAILFAPGIHVCKEGVWRFRGPRARSGYLPVWDEIVGRFEAAKHSRVGVDELIGVLGAPPFGLRAGLAPVLLTAALLTHAGEVALYEHGTFRPTLTPEVFERLVRNPAHFELKHFASRRGARRQFLTTVASLVSQLVPVPKPVTLIGVVSSLVSVVNALPEHVRHTKHLPAEAAAVRNAIAAATEPDDLLFSALPKAIGAAPLPPSATMSSRPLDRIAARLAAALDALTSAYPSLLLEVRAALCAATATPAAAVRANLTERARLLDGHILDPGVRAFASAVSSAVDDDDSWTDYVAMTVSGVPPRAWNDDDRARFFATVRDVGGTFRRLEALNHDKLAINAEDSAGFDAVRVTLTRPGGRESARVVWIDDTRRAALGPALESALASASEVVGGPLLARELLLALLAEDVDREAAPALRYGERAEDRGAAEAGG